MPYYIDPETKSVVVTIGSSADTRNMVSINSDLAQDLRLRNHQRLSDQQISALLQGSQFAFRAAPWPTDEESATGPLSSSDETIKSSSLANNSPRPLPPQPSTPSTTMPGSQAAARKPASRPMPASVARARAAAGTVEAFSWVILVLGVIAGIAVALQTDWAADGNGGSEKVHPYVGLGIGLAIGVAINCLMIIMVAAYIKAKMELAQRAG